MKKLPIKWIDVVAAANYVAGGGLTTVFALGGPKWAGFGAALIGVAGLIRVFAQKTGAPAAAVVADAKVVPVGTEIVHSDTPSVATVVSTTSDLLKGGSNGNK